MEQYFDSFLLGGVDWAYIQGHVVVILGSCNILLELTFILRFVYQTEDFILNGNLPEKNQDGFC